MQPPRKGKAPPAARGEELETARKRLSSEAGGDTSLGRTGTMEEIARALVWISSDEATYLNGTTITIDGGYVKAP